jgi:formate hydrogenlyase subunit 3/multisubunit Na+/H+ antiporter MnhD subunit
MGYSVIIEIGLSVIAMSLPTTGSAGLGILFLMILPRALALLVWSLSLTSIRNHEPSMRFADMQGLARRLPYSSLGITAASLAMAGAALLASFPARLALFEQTAAISTNTALWMGIGILGLFIGALRTLAVFVMAPAGSPWESLETGRQRIAIGAGVAALFVLGIFPQWSLPLLNRLPQVFEHLGK